MTVTSGDPLIEEARKKLEECLQARLCKPIVHGWIAWVLLLGAFSLSLFPENTERSILGLLFTLIGLFLWDTHFVSRTCRIQRWKDAFESFCQRYKDLMRCLVYLILPIVFWWPFSRPIPQLFPLPQLWRIMGMELYLVTLYVIQGLRSFPLDNPEIIRGFQASLLKPQLEVLHCAKESIANYPPAAREQLARQIEIQLSAQEGLTWPWIVGIGIVADRFIDLLPTLPSALFNDMLNTPLSRFLLVSAPILIILLRLTDRIYNYTALVQAVAQLEYESSLGSNKEDLSYAK